MHFAYFAWKELFAHGGPPARAADLPACCFAGGLACRGPADDRGFVKLGPALIISRRCAVGIEEDATDWRLTPLPPIGLAPVTVPLVELCKLLLPLSTLHSLHR